MTGGRARSVRRVGSLAGTAARRGALVVLAVWWVAPLVPVVVWSVADRWTYPALLPQQWGTAGWAAALGDGAGAAMLRSAALGAVVASVATPLGALAGHGLLTRARIGRIVADPFRCVVVRWEAPLLRRTSFAVSALAVTGRHRP